MHRGVRESKRSEGEHAEADVEGWRARRILHPRPAPPKCALNMQGVRPYVPLGWLSAAVLSAVAEEGKDGRKLYGILPRGF